MKEISPLFVILEIIKKDIRMYDGYSIIRGGKEFQLRRLSVVKNFGDYYNTLIGARVGQSPAISFGWNNKNIVVVLSCPYDEGYVVKIQSKNNNFVIDTLYSINAKDLKEDDIFQLTLEYGISKVELSDELYEFIFGE